MTDQDLERRLREALSTDVDGPAAEAMVAAARRGQLRRRNRRRASGAVALVGAVAVTAGVGSVLQNQPRSLPSDPGRTPGPTTSRSTHGEHPTTAAVAASDHDFFKMTSNVGCHACSTAWRRPPGGAWEKLHVFAREAYEGRADAGFGPLSHIGVSPDGTDMWATGHSMWSSHDGGRTWARVQTGPGRARSGTSAVAVTPERAFAIDYVNGIQSQVWVSPTQGDDWTPLQATAAVSLSAPLLPLGDRVAFLASGEGDSNPRIVATPDGTDFATLPLPANCPGNSSNPQTFGSTVVVACPTADGDAGTETVWRSLDLGPWQQIGDVASGLSPYPVSSSSVLAANRRGDNDMLLTPSGRVKIDVPSFFSLAVIGKVLLLDSGDGHDRMSTDGGLTWRTGIR